MFKAVNFDRPSKLGNSSNEFRIAKVKYRRSVSDENDGSVSTSGIPPKWMKVRWGIWSNMPGGTTFSLLLV
ncbi:unnamed protein product [Phytophthora lilii]|uniref:Unnamed protein product n=1 Tax=Phytophthora lilii TaxID=2077276 RepID=A0A9W7CUM4_9STRA|nr:unnamed protein product [Phytophthora lilii]